MVLVKRKLIIYVCFFAVFFSAIIIYAQQGFTGPVAGAGTSQVQAVTVSQVNEVPHKSCITLKGNLVQSIGQEYYTFRDSTGEITVEIEKKVWQGLSVGPSDYIEITAEVERKRGGRLEVEVINIRKI